MRPVGRRQISSLACLYYHYSRYCAVKNEWDSGKKRIPSHLVRTRPETSASRIPNQNNEEGFQGLAAIQIQQMLLVDEVAPEAEAGDSAYQKGVAEQKPFVAVLEVQKLVNWVLELELAASQDFSH